MPAANELARLDFTRLDRNQLLDELTGRIPSLTSKWTDVGPSDLGRILLELTAAIANVILLRADLNANETFLATARQRESVYQSVRLIGYRPSSRISSLATLTFSVDTAHTLSVSIPKFTSVSTAGVEVTMFYTSSDATLNAGDLSVSVSAKEGSLVTEQFTSDGSQPSLVYRFRNNDAGKNTVEVSIGTTIWKEVKNFLLSDSTSEHYVLRFDADDYGEVVFGDGAAGLIPPPGTVEVRYLRSSGIEGNVGAGTITKTQTALTDSGGARVALSVTNTGAALGGSDRQSLDRIKDLAPANLAALGRAVTKPDYIALLEQVDGVSRANAWGESEENPPNTRMRNIVRFTVAPSGGGEPPQPLVTTLFDFLEGTTEIEEKRMIGIRHYFLNPIYVEVNITATITVLFGYETSAVLNEVRSAMANFFSLANRRFAQDVRYSNVLRTVDNVPGVDYAELSFVQPGRLVGDNLGSFNISGTTNEFSLAFDGATTATVTLTTGTARTAQQVVTEINNVITGGTAMVTGTDQIEVRSSTTGENSVTNVKTGSANDVLGFQDNASDSGEEKTDISIGRQEIPVLGTVTLSGLAPV